MPKHKRRIKNIGNKKLYSILITLMDNVQYLFTFTKYQKFLPHGKLPALDKWDSIETLLTAFLTPTVLYGNYVPPYQLYD